MSNRVKNREEGGRGGRGEGEDSPNFGHSCCDFHFLAETSKFFDKEH